MINLGVQIANLIKGIGNLKKLKDCFRNHRLHQWLYDDFIIYNFVKMS